MNDEWTWEPRSEWGRAWLNRATLDRADRSDTEQGGQE